MDSQSFNGYQVPGSSPVNPSSIPYAISVRNLTGSRLTTVDVLNAAYRLEYTDHFTEIGSYAPAPGQYIVESPIQHVISYKHLLGHIAATPFICNLIYTCASSAQQGNRPLIYARRHPNDHGSVSMPLFPGTPSGAALYFVNTYQGKLTIDQHTSLFIPVLLPGEELTIYLYPSYYPSYYPSINP